MLEHKVVDCIDCHIAECNTTIADDGLRRSHIFRVEENLPYSCGTYPGGCHEVHKTEWAARQIAKGKIYGREKNSKGPKNDK